VVVTGAGAASAARSRFLPRAKAPRSSSTISAAPPTARAPSAAPAEEVVAEIKKNGGEAIANFDSVAEPPPPLISSGRGRALRPHRRRRQQRRHFARRIFHRMSIVDFEEVVKVHLFGSSIWRTRRALFPRAGIGSFVHFTSTSGLVGNFGQANYAAASLALRLVEIDRPRHGRFHVRSNAFRPSPGAG